MYGKQALSLLLLVLQRLSNLQATKFSDSIAKKYFHHLATELLTIVVWFGILNTTLKASNLC